MNDPVEILSRLSGLRVPMAIRVAATLRLADELADGPRGVAELAAAVGADPGALAGLLRLLASAGVVSAGDVSGGEAYALTETGRALTDDHPSGLRRQLDLEGLFGRIELAYAGLLESVRTGGPAYARVHGRGFWQDLAAEPELNAAFDELMGGFGHDEQFDVLARAYDWSSVERVVDLGGGDGALLERLLTAHPRLRGVLVDLPSRVAGARARFERSGADAGAGRSLAERCEVVAGSFFDPLPTGDVYVLSKVLDDWNDLDATAILRRCAAAARPGGRVLLTPGHDPAELSDDGSTWPDDRGGLMMLVLVGGRARTLPELLRVAADAGLEPSVVRPEFLELTPTP